MDRLNWIHLFVFGWLFVILIVFSKSVFSIDIPLSAGDWSFQYTSTIRDQTLYPQFWSYEQNNGFGGSNFLTIRLNHYFLLSSKLLTYFFQWSLVERVLWLIPALIMPFITAYLSIVRIFKNNTLAFMSAVLYSTNTYVLMIIGGGQLSVALGYAVLPPVLYVVYLLTTMKYRKKAYLYYTLILSLLFAVQILFYYRMTYIALIMSFIFVITYAPTTKQSVKRTLYSLFGIGLSTIIAILIHAYWIIPMLLYPSNISAQLGDAYTSIQSVKFFSFAKFEDSIALLHPNWPENIFGKTFFFRFEFIIYPVLAFSGLLLNGRIQEPNSNLKNRNISNEKKVIYSVFKYRLFMLSMGLIAIISAFLAKGANEPFGGLYLWLFENVPGFMMFRDSIKWYSLVSLTYSIMIPLSVVNIYYAIKQSRINHFLYSEFPKNRISSFFKLNNLFIVLLLLYAAYLYRFIFLGQLPGTFNPSPSPGEYVQLHKFISHQDEFFRTLWIPSTSRFSPASKLHPSISGFLLSEKLSLGSIDLNYLNTSEVENMLQKASVKYVIVPSDPKKEIFVTDRVYDNLLHNNLINQLDNYYDKKRTYGDISVYQLGSYCDHVYILEKDDRCQRVLFEAIDQTKYLISINTLPSSETNINLVLSEGFDKNWVATWDKGYVQSTPYLDKLNLFVVPSNVNKLSLEYKPQQSLYWGSLVSIFTILTVGVLILKLRVK